MRSFAGALAAATLAACAVPSARGPDSTLPTARAVQLARVRCLVVAPLENASDESLVADAATGALVSAIDPDRTSVYPIDDLRALFEHTPLELPPGVSASLALELGELVAADAVLYGSVEGRTRGPDPEVTLTLKLAATGVRDTLFWQSVRVVAKPDESLVEAARRAALGAARPILERMGVPGRKVCFDRQRLDRVRHLARTGDRPPATNPVTTPLPPRPPPVGPQAPEPEGAEVVTVTVPPPPPPVAGEGTAMESGTPASPPGQGTGTETGTPASPLASTSTSTTTTTSTTTGASPTPPASSSAATAPALDVEIVNAPAVLSALRARSRSSGREVAVIGSPPPPAAPPGKLTPRQTEFAGKLGKRERFVVEDVAFDGRSPRLVQQEGLVDLAAALAAKREVRVRIEGFVDASRSEKDDLRTSMELARAAGRRLIELGVSRDRVTWAGRGRDAPVAPNFTARGRATNRRVEVVVQ